MWAAVSCFAGLLAFGTGLWEARTRARMRRIGIHTSGVVVRLDSRAAVDGARMYTPIVEFIDETGSRREVRSRASSTRRPFAVGASVPVVHLPNRPQTARLDTRGEAMGTAGVGLGVGLLFVAIGAFLAVR